MIASSLHHQPAMLCSHKSPARVMEEQGVMMLDVCVVGSGVAGLSAALSLQNCGFRVKVFERDFDFVDRKQGYGLTLTYSTNGPLSKLGVLDECISNNCPSHCHYVFSPSGDVLGYYGRELKSVISDKPQTEQGGNRGNLRIPRQDLRMMLMQKLQPNTIQWGYSVADFTEYNDCVSVQFQRHFSDNSPAVTVDVKSLVVVGADGIRSKLRQLRDIKHFPSIPKSPSLSTANDKPTASSQPASTMSPIHYLGVAVIIGLSAASHAHVDQRGFYVVDGENRMFTMPYIAPQSTCDVNTSDASSASGQTMWQLSFSGLSEEQATALRRSSPEAILSEALRRTEGWFAPVADMIKATLPGELWATGLYDRDPMPQFAKDTKARSRVPSVTTTASGSTSTCSGPVAAPAGGSRVTVIGDAAHPMSMFKGQGANQALADGPLLAQWLSQGNSGAGGDKSAGAKRSRQGDNKARGSNEATPASIADEGPGAKPCSAAQEEEKVSEMRAALQNQNTVFTRLRCFEREMNARTTPKVLASREAAGHLHSPAVLQDVFGIAGVTARTTEENNKVLDFLRDAQVNAKLDTGLDAALKSAIDNYNGFC